MILTLVALARSRRLVCVLALVLALASYRALVHTVMYDSAFAARELALRAGVWDRAGVRAIDAVPRTTAEVPPERLANASALVVMLHGFRGYRHQFLRHERTVRACDPRAVVVIPELHNGGNARMEDVLQRLFVDVAVTHLPVAWIGISNGARVAAHAAADARWTGRQSLVLIAGALDGSRAATALRAVLPTLVTARFMSDAFATDMATPVPLPVLSAPCTRLHVHTVCAMYDWALWTSTCRVHTPCATVEQSAWYGHTSLPQVFADKYARMALDGLAR
jgi:pimeloyl-ACP methyl ester carboxylesterase